MRERIGRLARISSDATKSREETSSMRTSGSRFHFKEFSPLFLAAGLALCLTACGTTKPEPVVAASSSSSASSEIPVATIIEPAQQLNGTDNKRPAGVVGVRSRLLGGRTITLPPVRPLEVSTRCNFSNETGYKGDAVVEVKDGIVRQMRVLVDVPEPNKGRCIFEMSGMVQTKSMPSVELLNRATGCTARMWEQGTTAVVSFSNCATSCTSAESYKYVWPVLINRKTDQCQ
jgi:hypothetical protein